MNYDINDFLNEYSPVRRKNYKSLYEQSLEEIESLNNKIQKLINERDSLLISNENLKRLTKSNIKFFKKQFEELENKVPQHPHHNARGAGRKKSITKEIQDYIINQYNLGQTYKTIQIDLSLQGKEISVGSICSIIKKHKVCIVNPSL